MRIPLDETPERETAVAYLHGVVRDLPAALLPDNAATGLRNVLLDGAVARTRPGCERLALLADAPVLGLQWLAHATRPLLAVLTPAGLHALDRTGWSSYPRPVTERPAMATLNGSLYVTGPLLLRWDGIAAPGLEPVADGPTGATLLAAHTGRLFAAGFVDEPDAIAASTFFGDGWDPAALRMRIGGTAEPITALVPWTGNLLAVFQENAVHLLDCQPQATAETLANATLATVSSAMGCVVPGAAAVVGNDVWFLSATGLVSLRHTTRAGASEVTEPLSGPVRTWVEQLDRSRPVRLMPWRGWLFLNGWLAGESEPSSLVFDTVRRVWCGLWTGWGATCFGVTRFTGEATGLVFGTDGGVVRRWRGVRAGETTVDFEDDGAPVRTEMEGRPFFAKWQDRSKQALALEIEFRGGTARAEIAVRTTEGGEHPVATGVATAQPQPTLPLVVPFLLREPGTVVHREILLHLPSCSELQPVIRSESGKLAVSRVSAAAFLNAPNPFL
jgi:hypothetical protein